MGDDQMQDRPLHQPEFDCLPDEHSLLAVLRALDITVPGRNAGRKKEHRERWNAAWLLAALAGTRQLCFPLSCSKGERPDYILTMGEEDVGLEITEATRPDLEKFRAEGARVPRGDIVSFQISFRRSGTEQGGNAPHTR